MFDNSVFLCDVTNCTSGSMLLPCMHSNTQFLLQPAPAADTPDVGDMYSVPDKTKKKENQGVSYLLSDRCYSD